MKKPILLSALLLAFMFASAQHGHEHHQHAPQKKKAQPAPSKKAPADTAKKKASPKKPLIDTTHKHQHHMADHQMTHSYSLGLPMNRNGSGTSWLPDNTPIYAYMRHGKKGWGYMFHGNIFLRYTMQNFNNSYRRGGQEFDVPNWFMGMGQKRVGQNGLFSFTAMLSLDAMTVGEAGYPLLFQSGETWRGQPLIDRQHPHDLFTNLSVGYTQRINEDMDATIYLGYPGEPALGPPTFMHRISSISNPDAPLGHHWQDASHITFGVGTLGLRYKWLKAEGSIFTGREPDENRYDFERPLMDSYSYRLSANLSDALSVQVSQGFLHEPEALHPGTDVTRSSASLAHSVRLNENDHLNSALAWGFNDAGHGHEEHSLLAESGLGLGKNLLYARYEFVQKSAEELGLEEALGHRAVSNIHAFTLGASRKLWNAFATDLWLGAQLTMNAAPGELVPYYGDMPLSGQVYLRVSPQLLR